MRSLGNEAAKSVERVVSERLRKASEERAALEAFRLSLSELTNQMAKAENVEGKAFPLIFIVDDVRVLLTGAHGKRRHGIAPYIEEKSTTFGPPWAVGTKTKSLTSSSCNRLRIPSKPGPKTVGFSFSTGSIMRNLA